MTLGERVRMWCEIYGERDLYLSPGIEIRARRVMRRITELKDEIEAGAAKEVIADRLVSVMLRTFTLVYYDPKLKIQSYMGRKYGLTCVYCHEYPCNPQICTTVRPAPRIPEEPAPITRVWGVRDFQKHLRTLYLRKNRRRGPASLAEKLQSEIGEIGGFFHDMVERRVIPSLEAAREKFAFECCDLTAWVLGIANLYDIDLEDELNKRSLDRCSKCDDCPCSCPYHQ